MNCQATFLRSAGDRALMPIPQPPRNGLAGRPGAAARTGLAPTRPFSFVPLSNVGPYADGHTSVIAAFPDSKKAIASGRLKEATPPGWYGRMLWIMLMARATRFFFMMTDRKSVV